MIPIGEIAHVRTIRAESRRVGADELEVTGRLVGLSVMKGFLRAVNERFGRQLGCAHLTALIHAMAPVVKQGAGAAFHEEDAMPLPGQDLWFVNTCRAWREDGPLHARMRAGDRDGLRAFSARGGNGGGA